jgi:hypothetical protein
MVSRLNDADGPNASVTGVMISPASGMVVSNPSCTPAGAAIAWVNQGLPRWLTWWATHHRAHT